MQVDLVSEALTFMLLGMGIVFVFIILMIIAMNLLRGFVTRCFPDDMNGPTASQSSGSTAATNVAASKKNKVAAIFAAICRHQEVK